MASTPTMPLPGPDGEWYSEPVRSAAVERQDEGIDFRGEPGDYVFAIGRAHVDAVKDDPGGFGKAVYYTLHGGSQSEQQVYVGHALPLVKAGAHLERYSRVCQLLEHPLGNATVPGWTEIGFAEGNAPLADKIGAAKASDLFYGFLGGGRIGGLVGYRPTSLIPSKHSLTHHELEELWTYVGGKIGAADVAAAVAEAESAGCQYALAGPADIRPVKTCHYTKTNQENSCGLWQINLDAHADYKAPAIFHKRENARAAVAISKNGTDFTPWTTYRTGAYKQYLAASNVKSPGPPPKEGHVPHRVAASWREMIEFYAHTVPKRHAHARKLAHSYTDIFR